MSESRDKKYWKSLEEKDGDPIFLQTSKNEFVEEIFVEKAGDFLADESDAGTVSRRDFLKIMGFGVAAVSAAACSKMPIQKAIPYLNKPEEITPGVSYWYSSTCAGCTAHCSISVKNRDGRPIKIEGNSLSPLNRGGVCAIGQASVLDLYDSGRLQYPLYLGERTSWIENDVKIIDGLKRIKEKNGRVRILSSTITSPTTQKIISTFLSQFSDAKHLTYDAVSSSALIEAHRQVFGKAALPHYFFDKAKVIVSVGVNFLGTWISPVEFTKQYIKNRILDSDVRMSRHIQFETQLSLSGANADLRIPIKPSEQAIVVLGVLDAIQRAMGKGGIASVGDLLARASNSELPNFVSQTAKELVSARGESLFVSSSNDKAIQLAIIKINELLGNYDRTLDIKNPSWQRQGLDGDVAELVQEMLDGKIDALVLYNVNPVYDYPDAEKFSQALSKVELTISFSQRLDETADLVKFVCPDHHYLESWNDAQPVSGVYHLSQPVITPVYDTRSAQESLLKWQHLSSDYYDYLKAYWQENLFPLQNKQLLFISFWDECVRDGVFVSDRRNTASLPFNLEIDSSINQILSDYIKMSDQSSSGVLQISLIEKIAIRDGKHANNPWLQELPDPISKITWDNYLSIPPKLAEMEGLKQGDVVAITVDRHTVELPVVLQPGQALGTASIALGYGHTKIGKVGNGVGRNVFSFLTVKNGNRHCYAMATNWKKTGRVHSLAATQTHHSLEGRPIVRETTLEKFLHHSKDAGHESGHDDLVMLWEQHENKGHSWGMVVDLNACTGCAACVVSCQAENNVPVVGKDEVGRQREMHWIRLDRYFSSSPDNPEVVFQPMMCQHCANAPCESVCPVVATVHSSDGLNQQVYNRCVGTRYCANNCPYKVRRFNWFDYAHNNNFDYNMNDALGRMALNPDIVVRSRGVMEKCSLCIQRIQEGKLQAKKDGRDLRDSDIKTACQQSCPADAILFGDIGNPESEISKRLKSNSRRYQVLSELNVKPAVHYLEKVRNKG